jgi:hypothetical protein
MLSVAFKNVHSDHTYYEKGNIRSCVLQNVALVYSAPAAESNGG